MNVIFLTLSVNVNIEDRGIYSDLMRKFKNEGHHIYIVASVPRRTTKRTEIVEKDGVTYLNVWTLNIQQTNVIEKGIGTLLIENQYQHAIGKYLGNVNFDLILYSTPPITFTNVVKYLKMKNPNAISYLLLKDIFPQNAVDIGMFGEKSIFNWYFRKKEVELYKNSDYIGCMSPANVEFFIKHNPSYPIGHVEVAPNSVELAALDNFGLEKKVVVRKKYGLPINKTIFIYGGNLGKPQGIPFLMECLNKNGNRTDCHFVIVGSGTELPKLQRWYKHKRPVSVTLMCGVPKTEYDELVSCCDVGLIFLDHRFTIPNYPSRLLSYLENKMPILCATDPNTDIGSIAEKNGYGYWCESLEVENFTALIDKMLSSDIKIMGENGYNFLKANYQVDNTYDVIVSHF